MLTPKEYEAFKKKMLKTSKNRVYTSWWNAKGIKLVTFFIIKRGVMQIDESGFPLFLWA